MCLQYMGVPSGWSTFILIAINRHAFLNFRQLHKTQAFFCYWNFSYFRKCQDIHTFFSLSLLYIYIYICVCVCVCVCVFEDGIAVANVKYIFVKYERFVFITLTYTRTYIHTYIYIYIYILSEIEKEREQLMWAQIFDAFKGIFTGWSYSLK